LLACALALSAVVLPSAGAAARRPARHAAEVRRRAPTLDVQAMGATAAAVTDTMRARMREHVARQLRPLVDGRLLTSSRGYLVDGSIDELEVVVNAGGVEISCSVRLILSARRSGAMLLMTNGQATFKNARRGLKPAAEYRLELEVLDEAVRAASDELVSHFSLRNAT
jgi:hypothetical protein